MRRTHLTVKLSWKHLLAMALAASLLLLALFAILPPGALARGGGQSPAAHSSLHPFSLRSLDFTDGGRLPVRSEFNQDGCTGQNIAPRLFWFNVPAGTQGFAFTINDVDAPVAGGFHHWVVYNIPANVRTLNGKSPFSQGTNSFGLIGYDGPCPPADGQPHHYVFTLYALSVSHIAGQNLTYEQLLSAIANDVVGATSIIGIFSLPLK